MIDLGLANLGGRCAHGYAPVQLTFCADCSEQDEYAVFTAALRTAARGTEVHQRDVRPLIQHIPHKHRGLLYRRARQEGLIREIGMEPSTDIAGRNGDKLSRIYELRVA